MARGCGQGHHARGWEWAPHMPSLQESPSGGSLRTCSLGQPPASPGPHLSPGQHRTAGFWKPGAKDQEGAWAESLRPWGECGLSTDSALGSLALCCCCVTRGKGPPLWASSTSRDERICTQCDGNEASSYTVAPARRRCSGDDHHSSNNSSSPEGCGQRPSQHRTSSPMGHCSKLCL